MVCLFSADLLTICYVPDLGVDWKWVYESPVLAISLLCTSGQARQPLWTQLPRGGLWRGSR